MALGNNLVVKKKRHKNKQASHPPKAKSEKTDLKEEAIHTNHLAEENNIRNQYCVFKAGMEEYAISMNVVKEVVKFSKLAPIPQMPDYILGMCNVRGNIYGVMDLSCFFKDIVTNTERNYLLILDHDEFKMAISIERVPDSLIISGHEVERLNTSSLKSMVRQKFLQGIIKLEKRMIILINVLDMISSQEFSRQKV